MLIHTLTITTSEISAKTSSKPPPVTCMLSAEDDQMQSSRRGVFRSPGLRRWGSTSLTLWRTVNLLCRLNSASQNPPPSPWCWADEGGVLSQIRGLLRQPDPPLRGPGHRASPISLLLVSALLLLPLLSTEDRQNSNKRTCWHGPAEGSGWPGRVVRKGAGGPGGSHGRERVAQAGGTEGSGSPRRVGSLSCSGKGQRLTACYIFQNRHNSISSPARSSRTSHFPQRCGIYFRSLKPRWDSDFLDQENLRKRPARL